MAEAKQWAVSEQDMRGLAMRLDMLSTQYRKPKDISASGFNTALKTLRRWLSVAELGADVPVPLPVLEALCDDLNTPQAIAEMHKLAKSDPKGLFVSMKLLGLIPGEGIALDYGAAMEIKTIPTDHLPLPIWPENFLS